MTLAKLKAETKNALITLFRFTEVKPRRYNDAIVMLFHDVGEVASSFCVNQSVFERQIRFLQDREVSWRLASELAANLSAADDHRQICVTFDDGTTSSYQASLDLIAAGANCTQFIIPDRVERKFDKTMSWQQIAELDSLGVEIGSHSLTHPYLTRLGDEDLHRELKDSKMMLEDKLGKAVSSIAYPYGDFDRRVVEATRASGYSCGFTTQHLYSSAETDAYRIPRFETVESLNQVVDLFEGRAHLFYRLLGRFLHWRYDRQGQA